VEEARQKALAAEKNLTIAQRLAATGKLASGIAHEVNNPLAGMLNATRRLKEGMPTPEKHDEYCDLVIEGLQRIQETVKKILQFTPHKVAPQPVALETVLRRAIALASHRIERERVAVEVDLPSDARVFGDPFELQQVFLNIFLNSLDAIAEAEREKGAIVVRGSIAGTEIRLDVADNGCGMSEDLVTQAFDLFTTTKPVGEGTGLGLSIAHNVIENHGGRIEIASTPGTGTTVSIALPLLDGDR
jgi:signal transduction histidine kinase